MLVSVSDDLRLAAAAHIVGTLCTFGRKRVSQARTALISNRSDGDPNTPSLLLVEGSGRQERLRANPRAGFLFLRKKTTVVKKKWY